MAANKINSRKKGAKGEKKALVTLEAWTSKKFARVPSSGGLNWHNNISSGDVICVTEGHYFPFTVEVKNYAEINFNHLFYLEKADILKFWDQAVRDAERVKKVPLLMMRYDRLPGDFFFIAIPRDIYNKFFREYMDDTDVRFVSENYGICLMSSKAFFKAPYKEIRKPITKYMKTNG